MTQQTLFSAEDAPNPNPVERWQFPDNKTAITFADGLCRSGKYGGIKILPVAEGKPDRAVQAVKL